MKPIGTIHWGKWAESPKQFKSRRPLQSRWSSTCSFGSPETSWTNRCRSGPIPPRLAGAAYSVGGRCWRSASLPGGFLANIRHSQPVMFPQEFIWTFFGGMHMTFYKKTITLILVPMLNTSEMWICMVVTNIRFFRFPGDPFWVDIYSDRQTASMWPLFANTLT